jgi:UDP-glucose 4-epimerase
VRILVVGGAGYVGSVTVRHLLDADHQVIVLDNLSCGHKEAVPADALFIEGNMANANQTDSIFVEHKIETVVHLAAHSLISESIKQPAIYFSNNVVNGLRLLKSMLKNNVKRLVFSSSAAVYGEPGHSPIIEDAPLRPTNPYGNSKLAFERALSFYNNNADLQYISLRYFNAAGATNALGEDHQPETHLIPVLLEVAAGKRPFITIFGDDYTTPDGTPIRDYVHVRDLALANIAAVENLATSKQSNIFNLGSGTGYSAKQIVEVARKITGHPIPIQIGPRRPGDPSILIASNDKIQRVLGWKPQFSDVETMIQDAWFWYQKHPYGYHLEIADA